MTNSRERQIFLFSTLACASPDVMTRENRPAAVPLRSKDCLQTRSTHVSDCLAKSSATADVQEKLSTHFDTERHQVVAEQSSRSVAVTVRRVRAHTLAQLPSMNR